jgi:hypothetical protein
MNSGIGMDRTFVVASDERMIQLIGKAKNRLVVVCPALTKRVATAIAETLADEGKISITVILDADPEVYRLGYGTPEALNIVQNAAVKNMFDLRLQSGVRIGLVISDETTLVYAPVPLLIEAGATTSEKPNAIVFSGAATDRLANAAGAGPADAIMKQEIGSQALTPDKVKAVQDDLKSNPPQPFDIARALRVFSSKVQYVEFEAENYRFASRDVPFPAELLDVADDTLKQRISGRFRAFGATLGPFSIAVPGEAASAPEQIDEKWIMKERKKIEDITYVVPGYGRIILMTNRPVFDAAVAQFKKILDLYHAAVTAEIEKGKAELEQRIVKEFLPRWRENPPLRLKEHGVEATDANLNKELHHIAQQIAREAISFDAPRVNIVYKNIAPDSVTEPKFIDKLRQSMRRRKVPETVIDSLFATGDAAPAAVRKS